MAEKHCRPWVLNRAWLFPLENQTAKRFGDLADTFVEAVLQSGAQGLIHVIMFDRFFHQEWYPAVKEGGGNCERKGCVYFCKVG
jgi:hypothetical protein